MPRNPITRTAADRAAICDGKERLTADVAKSIQARATNREKRRTAYRCPVCRAWHIGTPPGKAFR